LIVMPFDFFCISFLFVEHLIDEPMQDEENISPGTMQCIFNIYGTLV